MWVVLYFQGSEPVVCSSSNNLKAAEADVERKAIDWVRKYNSRTGRGIGVKDLEKFVTTEQELLAPLS